MKKLICFLMVAVVLCLASCENVVSEVNQVVSDSVNVEFYHNGVSFDENDRLFENVVWEPGTVAVETLTVKNAGSLAVNYSVELLAEDAPSSFTDSLRVAVISDFSADMSREEIMAYFTEDSLYFKDVCHNFWSGSIFDGHSVDAVIAVYFPTEAANSVTQADVADCKFGARIMATQLVAEDDSFGQQYDYN